MQFLKFLATLENVYLVKLVTLEYVLYLQLP